MKPESLLILFFALIVFSTFEVFSEPYYHKTRVNFWNWAYGEIVELFTGEKEI